MENKIVTANEIKLHTPFRLTLSGPSGSGKTEWIYRFLQHRDEISDKKFDTILYSYGEDQPIFNKIRALHPDIIWCEGFCHDTINEKLHKPGSCKLMIVDDLLSDVRADKLFHMFYIRRSHHWNVSIVFTTQYLHEKGLRLINLNTSHFCLFKSVRDQLSVRTLALQMFPTTWRKFMEIYTHATR